MRTGLHTEFEIFKEIFSHAWEMLGISAKILLKNQFFRSSISENDYSKPKKLEKSCRCTSKSAIVTGITIGTIWTFPENGNLEHKMLDK